MNTPNKLTLLRVLLIPVFMVFASSQILSAGIFNGGFYEISYLIAGVIFAVASFTDFLDGYLARKNNLVTDFGKFADPLADKLLTTVAFIYMLVDGVCSPVVLMIILTREFAVSGVRMIAAGAPGGKVIAANMWGKIKTVLQMLTIIFYYFGMAANNLFSSRLNLIPTITYWLCWVVAIVTLVSGVQYIWANRSFINTAK